MTLRALLLAAALPLALQPLSTVAVSAAPALSAQDTADLKRVETYLDGVRTLQSDFVQVTDDGGTARGTILLDRPGRMRVDYEAPVRNFIVADGSFVHVWDAELEQQSNAPIGSTLADLLLRDRITLSGDVTVTNVTREPGVLEVTLLRTDEPGLGRLTLVFEDRPFRLRKWRILDAQGVMTEVALLNPQVGVKLDRDLFYFRDPTRKRERD